MKFLAKINVMPHKELLDPQGKAVTKNIHELDIQGVEDIRIGKHIEMTLHADSEQEANDKIKKSCEKLLTNRITETYTFAIQDL
ncbi:MAG TPA: phosphoribosylformylglycinamidine synthase subunit PurS [Saprospiraceae bacterium]|nr:phosphoribosylformylglycinamidine synthase subunit PurS [Saprospiraceae bacterium]HUN16219.1 phosphoribosylformylglycinamidine synthase subunit PurS [Saprospiraceae bacterium]